MRIVVDRFVSDADTTISRVNVDGSFTCFGLEDEYREEKLVHETRIPAGRYDVRLLTAGTLHEKYSKRFPDIHRGMLHLEDVPGFTGILIHVGNTEKDTDGCLLVGSQAITEPGQMSVTQSVSAYRRLYQLVADAAAAGGLDIDVQDNDRPLASGVARAPAPATTTPLSAADRAMQLRATTIAAQIPLDHKEPDFDGKIRVSFSENPTQGKKGRGWTRDARLELIQLAQHIQRNPGDTAKVSRFLALGQMVARK